LRGEATPAFVFLPDLPEAGATGAIEGDERHHVVTVCRAAVGDRATATDGNGRRATIRITDMGRRVEYEVESVESVARGPSALIACGSPEGTRGDWLIEKLAEFGIDRFQPLDTERARWRWSAARAARCDRLAVAALKQSLGAHRMKIESPVPLSAVWARSCDPAGARWLADPGGHQATGIPGATLFTGVCGPAPGLTPEECAVLMDAGFTPIRLGPAILRGETAGIALAALWSGLIAGSGAPGPG
jgi:16S rRNA (uracil1498-N3)-methyltransferase